MSTPRGQRVMDIKGAPGEDQQLTAASARGKRIEGRSRRMAQRLRFNTARDLFEAFPAALEDMDARPSDRGSLEFLKDLVAGPTPEDAITFSRLSARAQGGGLVGTPVPEHASGHLAPEDLAAAGAGRGLGAAARRGAPQQSRSKPAWPRRPRRRAYGSRWPPAGAAAHDGARCGAGDAAALSDRQSRQRRRARRAGAGRPASERAATLRAFVDMGIRLAMRA